MANSLLTINMITREAVRLWKNSNAFLSNVDTQYDDEFAVTGAKIGDTLRIRLPNDYTVRTGKAASVQDTTEQSTTLTLATQKGVDMTFSSSERTLQLDDFSERVLAPAINNLAGAVALDLMTGVEGGVCNLAQNLDAGGIIISPVADTYLDAGAILDENSAYTMDRKVFNDPRTQARVVSSLAGLFNPQAKISEQYMSGQMRGQALGFDWFSDQTILKHTPGSFTAGTVSGANQTGTNIVTNALTGTLEAGDIITFDLVFAVNRITKQSTGSLRQFVVTADVANGGLAIPVYPALIPAVGGVDVQYQTVTVSPANGAAIDLLTPPNTTYRKNIAYAPEAVTMVFADMELPRGVHEAARESFDGVSMRMITDYAVQTDEWITRLDILYGWLWVRPEWAVIVADRL